MKYTHATRKTSFKIKNTSCNKRSMISVTAGFFPVKERIFLVTGNLFLVTGIKEYLVSQYNFPVNERLYLVTGIKFPVTGRTKITLCHMKNISWHWRYTSCRRLDRLYSSHRNSDIACDNKIFSCQKNFSIDRQKN